MGSDSRKTKAQLIDELALAKQRIIALEATTASYALTKFNRINVELQKLEKQHSILLEKSNDAIIVLQDGLVKFANSKAAEITGFSAEAVLGKPFIDFVAPQYRELVMERYRKRLAGEEIPAKYEIGLLHRSGSVISVEVNASLIEYDGKPATLSIVRDITERKRIENSLKESEERYRVLFESSAEGIMIADIQTKKLLHPNPAICKMLGYSREELETLTVMDIHPKDSLEYVIAEFSALARGDRTQTTLPCMRKNGTIFYADIIATSAVIDGRNCNIGFFTDITERQHMANKLADSEVRYRRLFETAQDAILILNGDTGQITDANPYIKDLLGLSMEELIGKNLWEIGEFKDTLASKISYQELHESGYKRWDNLPFVSKDGRIISVEVVANAYLVDHTPVIQCNIRDMTVADLAVKTLKETKQDLEIAQRLTGIGNWKWIIAANKLIWSEELCHINGWDPNLPVPPFAEMGRFYTSESWERLNDLVTKAFNTGEPYGCELEQIRTDGTRLTTFSRGEADFDAGGKVIGLHGTVHDITDRKRLQEQLIMQDRLASIGQLVSGVAHELNNPLTSVIGFSELLLQRELPDDIKADLKIVNDEAKRTSLIVKNLLTFARQQPQDKRAIDINEPIQLVFQLRSHEQTANNIKVNTHLAPDLPQIMGNGSQLHQVFFNIVANAEQAMLEVHNKGTLTITTERVGNIVKARFTDDGPGISPENMKRLFTPFFTTKEIGKGTGLGLSICQGIIAEHGGRIYAESGLGEGATFIIELPIPP
ncbi:MAG: PAS domain S-box protein [Dehalococcoidales bacterium]|nr:PAS domain S-box protein [Dehalococcoidales bacterium]